MNWAWLNTFLTATAQVAQVVILISQHNWEKDKELKDAKAELTKEWSDAMASKDKSRVIAILQRVRDNGGN